MCVQLLSNLLDGSRFEEFCYIFERESKIDLSYSMENFKSFEKLKKKLSF